MERSALLGNDTGASSPQEDESTLQLTRRSTRRFLTSKTGHYTVLLLVSLDVAAIFADFILSLYACEHPGDDAKTRKIKDAQNVLGIISLVFSCSFMGELIAAVWAFGFPYFRSKFHIFDAFIILVSFLIDVCLKGVLEEIGSIVIVLRLWRVVKIIDELSAGAEEQMQQLSERLEACEREKASLATELETWKKRTNNGDHGSES